MEIERTKEVFRELAKLVVNMPKDPLSLGPDFLREQISICRNYLNQTSHYLQEVMEEQHLLSLELEDLKAQHQIQSDELLSNDLRVKQLPHIEDRQAMINVLLSAPLRNIQRIEREILNLKHVEKVVRHRLKELDNTMSAIRLQRSLLKDNLRLGGAYGDETNSSRNSSNDAVDEMSGDEIARLIDESEAEVAGTPDSLVQFEDEDEFLTSEPEPKLQDNPKNGLLCSECGTPQYKTRSGVVCENGHGGTEGVKPPKSTSKKQTAKVAPPVVEELEDPDQILLEELEDLIADGDDGETILEPKAEAAAPTTQDVGDLPKVDNNPLKDADIDEDMQRFLSEDDDDLDALIADI